MAVTRTLAADPVIGVGQTAAASQQKLTHVEPIRPSRRQFLKAAGIGGAAIGLSGLGIASWRASAQGVFAAGSGPAYAAWGDWDQGSGALTLVRAAVLSANPHNSQPWRFRIASSAIDMFVDPGRNMGAMDPYRREQHIGLGCSLENLLIAAQAKGYDPQLAVLPDPGDPTLVAHVDLKPGTVSNLALYGAIPKRHTHRAPFDATRNLSQSTLSGLDQEVADIHGAAIVWITSDTAKRQVGQLIVEAAQAIAADRDQSIDSFRWWRDSWSDIQTYKDGMTIDAAGLSPLITTLGKILPPQSREQNDQAWIQQTRDNNVKTAAAFGIVVVRDATDNAQRIAGGRLYQRLHLAAVNRGLAIQPLNQITERIDRERFVGVNPGFTQAAADLMPEPGWQALMSFRIGYPTVKASPSPRRRAESVLAPS
jgi:TAT (twin-arginine translocation) pathway signal sequence